MRGRARTGPGGGGAPPRHQRLRRRGDAVAAARIALWRDILGAVRRAPGAEVTAECNPEDASAARFEAWRAAGVTRVSFGVQSLVPHVLASLGRRHGSAEVVRAVALAAEAGFASFGVDLIVGAAAERDGDLAATVEAVLALEPRPRARERLRADRRAGHPAGRATRPATPTTTPAPAATSWPTACWRPPGTGGTRSRTGPCRATSAATTRLYWDQGDYRGIGCAAHSHRDGTAVVERAHPRALHRGGRGRSERHRRRGGPRPTSSAASRPWRWRCAPRRACPPPPCPTTPTSPVWWSGGGTGPCSPCGAGSWPTRSRPACASGGCTGPRTGAR